MKKRILSFCLALVLMMGLVAALPAPQAAADSLYIRKIVSVVYDDSGSMAGSNNTRWSYASYAMQTFAGLMNPDDRLFITYMSDVDAGVDNPTKELDVANPAIQNTVDGIRNHVEAGNTPYATVAYAWNTLLQAQDDDPNTQYWLVVMTDGDMGRSEDGMGEDFRNFTSTTMPNGSKPQVTFLAIGDGAIAPKKDPENSIYVYEAAESDKIVDAMSEMADRISGRRRLDNEVKKAGSNALKFTSDVPLLNIAVLCQNSAAALEGVTGPDGNLTISRTVSVKYPEANGWKTDKKLVGSAFVANGTGNLPAGEYTLTFADGIDPKDVVVMIEPALEIRITASRGGVELTPEELENLSAGEVVDVKATIYESGTDKEIDPALLPENTTYEMSVVENGSQVQSADTSEMLLEGITLNQVPTEFRAKVSMEGYNPILITSGVFTPQRAIEYTITATAPTPWEMDVAGLKQNTVRVVFTIFADGVQVTEDLGTLGFQVETELPGDLAFQDDGTITYQPKYQDPITALPTGEVEIKGTLPAGAEASVTVTIIPPEYKLEAESPVDVAVARTDLGKNTIGMTFRLYMDGIQQDKAAVEAAGLEWKLPEEYQKHVTLNTTIDANGDILVVPGYDGWRWFAAWRIPLGDLVVTASALGVEAQGVLPITWDPWYEIPFNYVIPLLVIAFIVGHIVKKRLPYGNKIRKSTGAGSVGSTIQVPANQWRVTGLWTWTALIPYLRDRKKVGDIKVYARGGAGIGIYPHKFPKASGFALGDYESGRLLSIYKSSIERFNQDEQQNPAGEKKKGNWLKRLREARRERIRKRRKNSRLVGFAAGSALVVSADTNYSTSTVYIYERKPRRRGRRRRPGR